MIEIKLLTLIIIANGIPLLAARLLKKRGSWPLDAGLRFLDGQPLLGPSKTLRCILATAILTPPFALLLGLSPWTGLIVGGSAMLGDLFSSFVKRRLRKPSGGMALGLDQLPESLLPLLAVRETYGPSIESCLWLALAFMALELIISRLLFQLHLRERPY